jgi:hypothetical protein
MRARFDQLAKGILGTVLARAGEVQTQKEIAGEVQAADVWFVPAAERAPDRARLGLLGRMAETPCLLEPFHATPGVDAILDCLCKQLTLRRNLRREARQNEAPPPQIPRLWILSSGRPEGALASLGFTTSDGWPAGIWQAAPSLSMFLVVVRDLPETRDTLALRLLGVGPVFRRAIDELDSLPPHDWERRALMPLLLAFRMEIPQDPEEDEMSYAEELQAVYDRWERQIEERERRRERRRALVGTYQARFGAVPESVHAGLEAADYDTLLRWVALFATGSAEEIAAAVLGASTANATPSAG